MIFSKALLYFDSSVPAISTQSSAFARVANNTIPAYTNAPFLLSEKERVRNLFTYADYAEELQYMDETR